MTIWRGRAVPAGGVPPERSHPGTATGLEGVRQVEGVPDVLLVPLGGHTAGHAGVAVRDGDRWLLHSGDAYFYHREMEVERQPHPLMEILQLDSQVDEELRLTNQARLRELSRTPGVEVFSAHDPWEFQRF